MRTRIKTVMINLADVELEVTGEYTAEEPMVMYYADGSGHPGSPSEFDITDIEFVSGNMMDLIDYFDMHCYEQVQKVRKKPETFATEGIWEVIINKSIEKIENEFV